MQSSRIGRLAGSAMLLILGLLIAPARRSAGQMQGSPDELPTIKVDVQLVSLTATVEDRSQRPVTGLDKTDFDLYEDGVRQDISVFHGERIPVSVGIVFDTSGSMVDKIDEVQDAVLHFADTTNPEDEIFLVQFSRQASLVEDFTGDRQRLRRAIQRLQPGGATALYDAVVLGLQHLQSGKYKKKALLVITDGNDTDSSATLDEAVLTAQQSEAIVYTIGIGHGEHGSFGHIGGGFKDTVDVNVLRRFSDTTGGRTFIIEGSHRRGGVDLIDQAALSISGDLRSQYTLGYYPRNKNRDGSYRRIEIRTRNNKYLVRTREGYFAPRG